MRLVTAQPTGRIGRLSEAVLQTIADAEGVDPADLEAPLYEALDPDALDALFRTDVGSVTFGYHGYTVTVFADGTVDIESRGTASGSTATC